MACRHYSNSCLVRFECCLSLHPCRLCHDEAEGHKADRYKVSHMVCCSCGLQQPKARECSQCLAPVSNYFCGRCNLWDSSGDKIFHCGKCNVCRRGDPRESFHCDSCQTCLSAVGPGTHTHVENTTGGNCPICAEDMSESTEVLVLLRCGHSLHERCFQEFVKETYTCPICSRPVGDTSVVNRKVERLLGMEASGTDTRKEAIARCRNCSSVSKYRDIAVHNKCLFCGVHAVATMAQESGGGEG